MSDLEACYDRPSPNVGGIVKESNGVNTETIKIVTKVLPRCKHCIVAVHGVSIEIYGGMNKLMRGIGKGHFFQVACAELFHVLCLKNREETIRNNISIEVQQ